MTFILQSNNICSKSYSKGKKLCQFKCCKVGVVKESLPCVAAQHDSSKSRNQVLCRTDDQVTKTEQQWNYGLKPSVLLEDYLIK